MLLSLIGIVASPERLDNGTGKSFGERGFVLGTENEKSTYRNAVFGHLNHTKMIILIRCQCQ
jgi:hypothetical protein